MSSLTKDQPNCVVVDSGNVADFAYKLDLTAKIMSELKYDAVGVGVSDQRLGGDFYAAFKNAKLPVLYACPKADPSTVPYVVKNVNGVRVGIVSFGDAVLNSGSGDEIVLRKSLYAAYLAARKASDVLILLDPTNVATPEWIERNRARMGAPDLVIGGLARSTFLDAQRYETTYSLPAGIQAKSVGVVDVEFTPGAPPKVAAQMIPLDEKVAEDEGIAKRVKELQDKVAGIPNPTASRAQVGLARPVQMNLTGKPYYSSEMCRGCHVKQYDDWQTSRHAEAVSGLARENRMLPDCMGCHSEAYRRTQNIETARDVTRGVECASCHIDSLPHGMERVHVAGKAKVDPKVCLDCHTKEWSPQYDEKTYFPKVAHAAAGATKTAATPKP